MTKKIKAQYIGKKTTLLIPDGIASLILLEEEPNTVDVKTFPIYTRLTYPDVYAFFQDWKLN